MQKINLEGLKVEEIRELIIHKKIDIHSVPIDSVRELFEYEIEWAEIDKSDEPTIINELLEALDAAGESNEAFEVVSSERCMELAKSAIAQTTRETSVRRPRVLKKIILIAAAIVILASLGVTVYASYFGPFDSFVDNVKDLFGIEVGEVIKKGDEELMADNTTRFYTDFEELMQENNITVLYPRGIEITDEKSLRIAYAGETKRIIANYGIATLTIEFFNPMYTESELLKSIPDVQILEINEFTYYDLSGEDFYQFVMFHNGFLYSITANNPNDLLSFIQTIK